MGILRKKRNPNVVRYAYVLKNKGFYGFYECDNSEIENVIKKLKAVKYEIRYFFVESYAYFNVYDAELKHWIEAARLDCLEAALGSFIEE